jgi:hypothetical protein
MITVSLMTGSSMRRPVLLSVRIPNLASIYVSIVNTDVGLSLRLRRRSSGNSMAFGYYLDVGVVTVLKKKLANRTDDVVHDIGSKEGVVASRRWNWMLLGLGLGLWWLLWLRSDDDLGWVCKHLWTRFLGRWFLVIES